MLYHVVVDLKDRATHWKYIVALLALALILGACDGIFDISDDDDPAPPSDQLLTILGTVSIGESIADATVALYADGFVQSVRTNSDGDYRIELSGSELDSIYERDVRLVAHFDLEEDFTILRSLVIPVDRSSHVTAHISSLTDYAVRLYTLYHSGGYYNWEQADITDSGSALRGAFDAVKTSIERVVGLTANVDIVHGDGSSALPDSLSKIVDVWRFEARQFAGIPTRETIIGLVDPNDNDRRIAEATLGNDALLTTSPSLRTRLAIEDLQRQARGILDTLQPPRIVHAMQQPANRPPHFGQQRYEFTVVEGDYNADNPLSVGSVRAAGATDYAITGGNDGGTFGIDITGLLYAFGELDSQTQASWTLAIIATNDDGRDSAQVAITVDPRSSIPPNFDERSYGFDIIEGDWSADNTRRVGSVQASGAASYAITAGNERARFAIDTTGLIEAVNPLDRQMQHIYTLMITATNSQGDDSVLVIITVLPPPQSAPNFDAARYTFDAIEGEWGWNARGEVGVVQASDTDWYAITEGNDENNFFIETTGRISAIGSLIRQERATWTLTITAYNSLGRDTAQVVITVLPPPQSAPNFDAARYTFDAIEGAWSAGNTHRVGSVRASDAASYAITAGNTGARFAIDNTGLMEAVNPLDRQTQHTYILTITATNPQGRDTAQVVITVLPPPQSAPNFDASRYTFDAIEGAWSAGNTRRVGSVRASDAASYAITAGNTGARFAIDTTGLIEAVNPLDRQMQHIYTLMITATNPQGRDTAQVVITVLPPPQSAPNFDAARYTFDTIEGAWSAGNTRRVGSVRASDAASYAITAGNTGARFAIDNTGLIEAVNPLDRQTRITYTLTITATNPQGQDSVPVIITVLPPPQSPPNFDAARYGFNAIEGAWSAGNTRRVGSVRASDAASYAITAGNTGARFAIDNTGLIEAVNPLDRQTRITYTLTITATNPQGQDTAQVVITVVRPPATGGFSANQSFDLQVREDGEFVSFETTELTGATLDLGTLTFATEGTFEPEQFILLPSARPFGITGVATLTVDPTGLDFEAASKNRFTLPLYATDRGLTSPNPVTLAVEVVDLALLTGTATVAETYPSNPPQNVTITLNNPAYRLDRVSSIRSSTPQNAPFAINAGQLQALPSLDYETRTSYGLVLRVEITHAGTSELEDIPVEIEVINIKDGGLIAETHSVTVSESAGGNSEIARLTFRVNDFTPARYGLTGVGNERFLLEPNGRLKLAGGTLDYEGSQRYSLRVIAYNADGYQSPTQATIVITVTNVEEGGLRFINGATPYQATVQEDGEITWPSEGRFLIITDDFTPVTYRLTGEGSDLFDIIPVVGMPDHAELQIVGALDYESGTSYSLQVTATNGVGATSDIMVRMEITVTNVEEGGFTGGPYEAFIYEDGRVQAQSPTFRTDDFTPVEYTLVGEGADLFEINAVGTVSVAEGAILSAGSSYSLTLGGINREGLTASTSVSLQITIVAVDND